MIAKHIAKALKKKHKQEAKPVKSWPGRSEPEIGTFHRGQTQSEEEETDICPKHGEQKVVGHSQTPGADPYLINKLACGDKVICMGPGEPNTIV